MRFSLRDALLAPLPLPVVCCAMLAVLQSGHPVFAFLLTLIPASIISYGTMFGIFLPCLYLLSLWQPLTGLKVCLLGAVLGAAVYLPLAWMMWKSSGIDSGPPSDTFLAYLLWSFDPFMVLFPLAGLTTAALYWWLGTRPQGQPVAVPE